MADIEVLATFDHYVQHMMPIVDALRDNGVDVRVWSGQRNNTLWGEFIHPSDIERMGRKLWMVAASVDASKCLGQQLIYVEHGAGQTYTGDSRSVAAHGYSSGRMDDAVLFLCPNVYVMQRRRETHPDTPAYLVGCPAMDQYYLDTERAGVQDNVVAITWHWNCGVCDETKTAFFHYQHAFNRYVLGLRREGYRVVGHAHPRIRKRAQWHYERHGIEWWDYEQVMNEAAMLCVDNSSIGYEFASLDRPVLWLNAPHFRRSVHHGLRFWEYIPGEQCDEPQDWVDKTLKVLADDSMSDWRMHVSDLVYPLRDGLSARRAAMAIERLL